MKKKDVLILLKKHPGRAAVSQAVQWITNQRASTDSFGTVLELLLANPEFDSYLLWFSQWMISVHWNVLQSSVSTELFNASLGILERTLHLPDRGRVLVLYLEMFYDDRLTRVARKWLAQYGGVSSSGSEVAAKLVLADRSPEYFDFARGLADKSTDSKLVCALLDYCANSEIEELGLRCLADFEGTDRSEVAGALMRRNSSFGNSVRDFLSRISETEMSLGTIGSIAASSPEASDLVLDWICAHEQSTKVPDWLVGVLFSGATSRSYQFAWHWFKSNEGEGRSLDVLLSIVNGKGGRPPVEMVEYAMRWARVNEEHELASHFFYAIVTAGSPEQKVQYGHYCLPDFDVEDQGMALRAMVKHSGDIESVRLAKRWIHTYEKDQTDDFVASIILLLLQKGPDSKLLELAKRRLAKSKSGDEAAYIEILLESGDPDGLVEAKKYLLPHRLENRARDKHMQNGRLLKGLVSRCPQDPLVLEKARIWLSREVHRHEENEKASVQTAYDEALVAAKIDGPQSIARGG